MTFFFFSSLVLQYIHCAWTDNSALYDTLLCLCGRDAVFLHYGAQTDAWCSPYLNQLKVLVKSLTALWPFTIEFRGFLSCRGSLSQLSYLT